MSFPLGFLKEKYSLQEAQEDIYCIAATAKKITILIILLLLQKGYGTFSYKLRHAS